MKLKARALTASEHAYIIRQIASRRTGHLWTLWGILFETGMRPGELLGLRLGDIARDGGRVRLSRPLKGGVVRELSVSPQLGERLQRLRQMADVDMPLYKLVLGDVVKGTARNKLDAAWCREKVNSVCLGEDLQLYSFRHNYGTKIFEHYRDVFMLQGLMGHRSLSSTAHYIQAINVSEQSKAVNGLFSAVKGQK